MNVVRPARVNTRPWRFLGHVVAVGFSIAIANSAYAQVLDQVPSDAAVVIKIRNFKQGSDKVAAMAQQWGIQGLRPDLKDPIAHFKQTSGFAKGLADDGEVAAYLMQIPLSGEEPTPVVLLPVSDYDALLKNFADAKVTKDVAAVTLKTGDKAFVAKRGKYAAVGMNALALATPAKAGMTPSKSGLKELDSRDFSVLINFQAVQSQATSRLAAREQQLNDRLGEAPADQQDVASALPIIKAISQQVSKTARGFLAEGRDVVMGFDLSEAGIATSTLYNVKADTYSSDVIAQLKPAGSDLLSGLPSGEFIVAGGVMMDRNVAAKVVGDFLAPIRGSLNEAQASTATTWINAAERYLTSVDAWKFGITAPTGDDASSIQAMSILSGDAKKLADAKSTILTSQDALLNGAIAGAVGGDAAGSTNIRTVVTPNAKAVEGVGFSTFDSKVNLGMESGNMTEQMIRETIASMGGTRAAGIFGVVDDKHLLTILGGNGTTIASAVKSARGNITPAANAKLAGVKDKLPGDRIGEAYVSFEQIIRAITVAAKANGADVQLTVPEGLEPFAFGLTKTEENGLRLDGFFPSDSLQALSALGLQVGAQFQQGFNDAQKPGEL